MVEQFRIGNSSIGLILTCFSFLCLKFHHVVAAPTSSVVEISCASILTIYPSSLKCELKSRFTL